MKHPPLPLRQNGQPTAMVARHFIKMTDIGWCLLRSNRETICLNDRDVINDLAAREELAAVAIACCEDHGSRIDTYLRAVWRREETACFNQVQHLIEERDEAAFTADAWRWFAKGVLKGYKGCKTTTKPKGGE